MPCRVCSKQVSFRLLEVYALRFNDSLPTVDQLGVFHQKRVRDFSHCLLVAVSLATKTDCHSLFFVSPLDCDALVNFKS